MPFDRFNGGTPSARRKLNALVDHAERTSSFLGDGFVSTAQTPGGVSVGLDIPSLVSRLPVRPELRFGLAAGVAARSDDCATIGTTGESPHCYVIPLVTNGEIVLSQSTAVAEYTPSGWDLGTSKVTTSNASDLLKVYFLAGNIQGNYGGSAVSHPIAFHNDVIPYWSVRDIEMGYDFGICTAAGFFDAPIGTMRPIDSGGALPARAVFHEGWGRMGNSGTTLYGPSSSLSDAGTPASLTQLEGTFVFGAGTKATSPFSVTAPGMTATKGTLDYTGPSGETMFGYSVDWYKRVY